MHKYNKNIASVEIYTILYQSHRWLSFLFLPNCWLHSNLTQTLCCFHLNNYMNNNPMLTGYTGYFFDGFSVKYDDHMQYIYLEREISNIRKVERGCLAFKLCIESILCVCFVLI